MRVSAYNEKCNHFLSKNFPMKYQRVFSLALCEKPLYPEVRFKHHQRQFTYNTCDFIRINYSKMICILNHRVNLRKNVVERFRIWHANVWVICLILINRWVKFSFKSRDKIYIFNQISLLLYCICVCIYVYVLLRTDCAKTFHINSWSCRQETMAKIMASMAEMHHGNTKTRKYLLGSQKQSHVDESQ